LDPRGAKQRSFSWVPGVAERPCLSSRVYRLRFAASITAGRVYASCQAFVSPEKTEDDGHAADKMGKKRELSARGEQ
jgi:hypothetical protein